MIGIQKLKFVNIEQATLGCPEKTFFFILLIALNQWCQMVRRATKIFFQNYRPINKNLPLVFVFWSFKVVKGAEKYDFQKLA